MTKDGKLNIGPAYCPQFNELAQLTGKKDTETVRQIVENILFDAKQKGLTSVPIQTIGIKESLVPTTQAQ